jgi:perosamine synthetase
MIPVAGPSITELEQKYVAEAVSQAWYDDAGVFHDRFEQAFAEKVGRRHAVALPSCTSAIHLALAALGIGHGDEVIVPDLTWIASAAPIHYVGARPVFADVEPSSWCLDPESVRSCLGPRTRAIVAVDLYGAMPDYDALRKVADEARVPLIEDAAEAIGSMHRGRPAGSLGHVGVFSFHGSKTMTTGEGGMLVTDDGRLDAVVRMLRDHGRAPGDRFFQNQRIAFKYKMSSMQAALGLAQLERLEELVAKKREIFSWYVEELADLPGVELNPATRAVRSSYWMTTLLLPEGGADKAELQRHLREQDIDSRPMFHPLSSLPAYRGSPAAVAGARRNRHSYALAPRGINLPSALCLTRDDVAKVGAAVRSFLEPRLQPVPSRPVARGSDVAMRCAP